VGWGPLRNGWNDRDAGGIHIGLAGEGDDFGGVENEPNAAIAEDGAAGHALNLADPAERFGNDLLLAEELVDEEGTAELALANHDEQALGGILDGARDVEQAMQAQDG
jgi:hypothetical protein